MTTPISAAVRNENPTGNSDSDEQMSLESVKASGAVDGLMLTMTVSQSYRNRSARVLETVYTFPLAFGAVLLGVSAVIAGRRMQGTVKRQRDAQQEYESAIASGDAPILVEKSADNLYTANLGNLKPGEEAVIELRYAQLLHKAQDRVQIRLPTTIAPRYGSAAAAGIRSHETVETSLAVSYPFELQVDVNGALSQGEVSSPSHRIAVMRTAQGVSARLAQRSWLDRDFILDLTQPASSPLPCEALLAPSGSGCVALASIYAPFAHAHRAAIDLKILVDCSGSMAGDSITQSRAALHQVLSELNPTDQFTLSRFGSGTEHEFKRLTPADEAGLERAAQVLKRTEADMGGTELKMALTEVCSIRGARDRSDILLITDGDIWDIWYSVRNARNSNHRIFAIGVGSAPAESLLRQLALDTGGACELVSPTEDMKPAVMRMLHRIRSRRTQSLSIDWGRKPNWVTQLPQSLFAGDTIHVFAGFNEPAHELKATLTCQFESNAAPVAGTPPSPRKTTETDEANPTLQITSSALPAEAPASSAIPSDLPRLAAWQRIADAAERIQGRDSAREWATNLAREHQLVTQDTSLFMVHEREASQKTNGIPELQQITHMHAAGWGGMGSVNEWEDFDDEGNPVVIRSHRSAQLVVDDACEFAPEGDSIESLDHVFNARASGNEPEPEISIEDLLDHMEDALYEPEDLDNPERVLRPFEMPDRITGLLDALVALGLTRRQAWALFLHEVIRRFAYEGLPGAESMQTIEGVVATIADPEAPPIKALMDALFEHATLSSW
jgi:Ca-activated chloride channel family protein